MGIASSAIQRARPLSNALDRPAPPTARGPGRWDRASTWIVPALLLLFAAQGLSGMLYTSVSSDETAHLPAGYTYWKTGEHRLNPQHPPLAKLLAAAPLLLLEPTLNLRDPGWADAPVDEWGFGARFLHGNDADRLLFWGRLPILLLGVGLGLVTYLWARDLFGARAGWLVLLLFALEPNLVAHAQFVTMDVPLAFFFVTALYCGWRASRAPSVGWSVSSGAALGAALGTKFSAVVLLPVLAILALASLVTSPAVERRTRAAGIFLAAGVAAAVLWAVYFFPGDPFFYWDGVRRVNADHLPTYSYYLDGEFRVGGFPHYFLMAVLYKMPLPTLLLVVASVPAVAWHRGASWLDEAFLWLPIPAFFLATSLYADDLGVRYLLPVFPLLLVSVGRLVRVLSERRAGRAALVAAGVWLAFEVVSIHPHQLAYFNTLAGGASQGHRHLDDSNIDWGQSLKGLKAYLDEHGIESVRLLYAWNGDPAYYGIRALPVSDTEWAVRRPPGLYAVSTHLLIRGRLFAREKGYDTDWLDRYEPVGRIGYSMYLFRFD